VVEVLGGAVNAFELALQQRQCEALAIAVEEARLKVRAALACAEREELAKEYVFEVMAREIGREGAMRELSRIRLVETAAGVGEKVAGLEVVP
jgi:hypothetical protein